jgi:4-amino-4-deoxy-L-arabinose transferase-like glycosyltransferase
MPVTFFFLLGLSLTQRHLRGRGLLLAPAAGVAIGLGLVSKYTMLLIYPVLFCHVVVASAEPGRGWDCLRGMWARAAVSILVSAAILGAWLLYADSQGILAPQAERVSGYARLVTRGGWDYMAEMISTELTSAVGFYHLTLAFLGLLCLLCERRRSDLLVLLWMAPVFGVVALTVPDPRYFMPAFPALALAMARGLRHFVRGQERVVLLALLLCAGSLYLFADWYRAAFLFIP